MIQDKAPACLCYTFFFCKIDFEASCFHCKAWGVVLTGQVARKCDLSSFLYERSRATGIILHWIPESFKNTQSLRYLSNVKSGIQRSLKKGVKFTGVFVGIYSWLRYTSLAVKSSSCSWSSTPTRLTYSTGLWIAATQAPTSSPQAASKPSLQSAAAGTKSPNLSVICSTTQLPVHIFIKGS